MENPHDFVLRTQLSSSYISGDPLEFPALPTSMTQPSFPASDLCLESQKEDTSEKIIISSATSKASDPQDKPSDEVDPPTLVYYESHGEADCIRIAFSLCGISWREKKVTSSNERECRLSSPFCELPCLHIDGLTLSGGTASLRYICSRNGLCGPNLETQTLLEIVVGVCTELVWTMWNAMNDLDAEEEEESRREHRKQLLYKKFIKGRLLFLNREFVKCHPGPFLLGSRPSFGDIHAFSSLDAIVRCFPNSLVPFPGLSSFYEEFNALPEISLLNQSGKRF
ncbi:hematopoietic prostaglandin D synthase-like [Aduncisulcus paluster]|uniref:Hematopoietic prostaglandin D synthase-like n=1 Tax=Aduncisulcus paluster TaxID=2918883 RepID=A0ABQ5KIV9_9EUKA|nr:hematopoietic prostaglandin D synthase-like [Aduncisulcus paluster]